jgi:hypothetical protein
MARTKKYKKKQDSDDEEFALPSPTTSTDDESFVGEEEDLADLALVPAMTQGTSDAVYNLLNLGARRFDPEPHLTLAEELTQELELARDPEEDDLEPDEVTAVLVRECTPFVPHRILVAQSKFENTPSPPTNAATGVAVPQQPSTAIAPPVLAGPTQPLTTAASIANALEVDNNESLDFDEDELKLLSAAENVGKRTQKHEGKIGNLIKRWFQTIADHGGDILKSLLVQVPANYNNGRTRDYAFFNILGGEKDYEKTLILNKCCILCGMKWLCLSGPNKGQALSPISFTKYMSIIFNEFRVKRDMAYDFKKDFNDKGQFHGVMITNWNKIRQNDPKFGTKQHQAQFDWEADSKIREAIKKGDLKPY